MKACVAKICRATAIFAITVQLVAANAFASPGDTPAALSGDYLRELGGQELITLANSEGTVVLYSSNGEADTRAWGEAFHRQFPRIQVDVVRRGGSELYELIKAEQTAGKLRADVIDISSATLLMDLDKRFNLIAAYKAPSASAYPPNSIQQGKIYSSIILVPGIAYNTALVDKDHTPKSWRDLLDPMYQGRVGHVAVGAGGCAFMPGLFEAEVLGKDYWTKFAQLKPKIATTSGALNQQVISGAIKAGIVNDATVRQAIKAGAPLALVYPTEGAPVCVYGTGVTSNSKHPNAARLLLNWMLSKDGGQTVWVKDRLGVSAREDVPMPSGLNRETLKRWLPTVDFVGERFERYSREWNSVMGFTP